MIDRQSHQFRRNIIRVFSCPIIKSGTPSRGQRNNFASWYLSKSIHKFELKIKAVRCWLNFSCATPGLMPIDVFLFPLQILSKSDAHGGGSAPSSPTAVSPTHASTSKHIIPTDAIMVTKTLGTGEFGTVEQGVWTNDDGERVRATIHTCLLVVGRLSENSSIWLK